MRLLKAFGAIVLAGTFAASCARSPEYEKDQDIYRPESSYYNAGTDSKTAKLESQGQPKKRAVIFSFWNDTPVTSTTLGPFAADELKRGLAHSQRVIVPKDVNTTLSSEDFVSGDKVKVAQLIREGRRLGVGVIIIGRITRIVFRTKGDEIGVFRSKTAAAAADVQLKVFDVAGGREIASMGRSGETEATSVVTAEEENLESRGYREEMARLAIRDAVAKLVPDALKALQKLVWEGRIAKIVGKRYYVNAGRNSGLVAGDILKVMSIGEDIHDPTTGAFLGRSSGQLKGTLEVFDFIGTDATVCELHSGGNFLEGDVVQLY